MRTKKPGYLNMIYLAIIVVIAALAIWLLAYNDKSADLSTGNKGRQGEETAYIARILKEREVKNMVITDSTRSRFNREERAHFAKKGLQYFPPDPDFRVMADFVTDTSTPVFPMPTNTERKPNYRIYGYVHFIIHDTLCKLTVYQNADYMKSPDYDSTLFVPFMDNTNGIYTYGGGRYMDIPIPKSDSIILDFNEAYNPYCAYSSRWSCPLVPFENDLNVSITAGEKQYK